MKWNLSTVPLLSELMLTKIVNDFKKFPHLEDLPTQKQRQLVLDALPATLPLKITANLINDDSYWKKVCESRWPLKLPEDGVTWKQLFFEEHFCSVLELYLPKEDEESDKINIERPKTLKDIIELANLTKDYIKKLNIDQLLPPINGETNDKLDLEKCLAPLTNLESLSVTYQVKKCGMNFEWRLFDFTSFDCEVLVKAILSHQKKLQTVKVPRSNLSCKLVRTFCAHMLKHENLVHLDLSRNEIRDSGARAIAKLMTIVQSLKVLKVGDNRIGNDGCKAIAAALVKGSCQVEELECEQNAFDDDASSSIMVALEHNKKLRKLNLASNQVNQLTIQALCQSLNSNKTLESLDLHGNEFGVQVGRILQEGLETSKSITHIDIRLTGTGTENEYTILSIVENNRKSKSGD